MMASLSKDGRTGAYRLLVVDGAARRSLWLGTMPKATAKGVQARVEAIMSAKQAGTAIDSDSAQWLAKVGDDLHGRMVRLGLVPPRAAAAEVVTVGTLIDAFFRSYEGKPATLRRMGQNKRTLIAHFSRDTEVSAIDERAADGWREAMKANYAGATVSRAVKFARQVWKWGVRRDMVKGNPFLEVKAGPQNNPARTVFVGREEVARLKAATADPAWHLLIDLSRFGGLRVPSESAALRWSDIDFANKRILVRSSKTEHYEGKGERVVPLFPELEQSLLAMFSRAKEGEDRVFTEWPSGYNPHTQLVRLMRRAGLTPWPRAFHNLRGSRETELSAEFPSHVVGRWIGNSHAVARDHYLTVRESDFERATRPRAHPTAQQVAASRGEQGGDMGAGEPQGTGEAGFSGNRAQVAPVRPNSPSQPEGPRVVPMPPKGLEHPQDSTGNAGGKPLMRTPNSALGAETTLDRLAAALASMSPSDRDALLARLGVSL